MQPKTTLLFKFYYTKSSNCQQTVSVVRPPFTYEYSYFQEQKQQLKMTTDSNAQRSAATCN